MDIIEELHLDLDSIVTVIYKAGGVQPFGYGMLSGGYGGGIEQDDYFQILHLQGMFHVLSIVARDKYMALLHRLNDELKAKFPDEITDENVPFINLDVRT